MRRLSRGLVAAVVLTCAAVALLGKSASVGAQSAGASSEWVKIGQYRINGDNISYVYDDGQVLHIHFVTAQGTPTLKGPDADALRRWIDARAADPMGAGRRPSAPAAR